MTFKIQAISYLFCLPVTEDQCLNFWVGTVIRCESLSKAVIHYNSGQNLIKITVNLLDGLHDFLRTFRE